MSYDINLIDPINNKTLLLDSPHYMKGGTYKIGGEERAHLNITYNYSPFFEKVLGDNGIRSLYGKSAVDTISILEKAIKNLKDDSTNNYWDATEGNAKKSLIQLLALAKMRPDGIWDGD